MTGACSVLVARVIVHSPHGPFTEKSDEKTELVAKAPMTEDEVAAELGFRVYGELSEAEIAEARRAFVGRAPVFLPVRSEVSLTRDRVPSPQRPAAASTQQRATENSSSNRYSTYYRPFTRERHATGTSEFKRSRIERDRQLRRYREAQDRRNRHGYRR
jgi:hypothetical protein